MAMKKEYRILTEVRDSDGFKDGLDAIGAPLETVFLAEIKVEKLIDRYPHDIFFIIPQYTKA